MRNKLDANGERQHVQHDENLNVEIASSEDRPHENINFRMREVVKSKVDSAWVTATFLFSVP